jgi:hypothetical protein
MTLHLEPRLTKAGRELLAQVPVSEEDAGQDLWRCRWAPQAARSYSAACSMSAGVTS